MRTHDFFIPMETFFLLALMMLAHLLGAGVAMGGGKFLGFSPPPGSMALLVLGMPLAAAWLAEFTTGLWRHTPGTLGLGSLTVALPMAVSGLFTAAVAIGLCRRLNSASILFSRDSPALTAWVTLALAATMLTLALWRYWPEPRARLW
jgi:hypothetical protein